jgi:hypothetical protein
MTNRRIGRAVLAAGAALLGIAGSLAISSPAHAAFLGNSCGPNYSWSGTTAREDVYVFHFSTNVRVALRHGWGTQGNLHWASVSDAPAGTRVWMDWTDDGGRDWHRCGNGSAGWSTVASGSSGASTKAINLVPGRRFAACANVPGGSNVCGDWSYGA